MSLLFNKFSMSAAAFGIAALSLSFQDGDLSSPAKASVPSVENTDDVANLIKANENPVLDSKSRFFLQFGEAAKPVAGLTDFCKRLPDACSFKGDAVQIYMTEEKRALIDEINRTTNKTIQPMLDQDNYGQEEFWTLTDYDDNDVMKGDCEDYVLDKINKLYAAGISKSSMAIVYVKDLGEGHAVLALNTNEGTYILDNLNDDMKFPFQTRLEFIQATSPTDIQKWQKLEPVALEQDDVIATASAENVAVADDRQTPRFQELPTRGPVPKLRPNGR